MAGENPLARPLYEDIRNQYPDVSFLGIWGDANHQKRKSDHNTGDAVDIGFGKNYKTGEQILRTVLQKPGVKYAILGRDVYYPNGNVSVNGSPYNHNTHVHVSLLRDGKSNSGDSMTAPVTQQATPMYRLADYKGSTIYNHLYSIAQMIPGIDPESIYVQGGRIYANRTA